MDTNAWGIKEKGGEAEVRSMWELKDKLRFAEVTSLLKYREKKCSLLHTDLKAAHLLGLHGSGP